MPPKRTKQTRLKAQHSTPSSIRSLKSGCVPWTQRQMFARRTSPAKAALSRQTTPKVSNMLIHAPRHQHGDDDLSDLLESSSGTEIAPLNLDHLTRTKQGFPQQLHYISSSSHPYKDMNMLDRFFAYISVLCHYYPRTCAALTMGLVFSVMVLFGSMILNPTQEFGIMPHDHSNIKSKYDFDMVDIDHWCLRGGDAGCHCEDPLVPVSRFEHRSWMQAFKMNRKIIKKYEDPNQSLDVAFLGESIVEEMDGRWMGRTRPAELQTVSTIFKNHFSKKHGAPIEGVALGIAGDTAPNVLWRLMHGEMPDYFQPKVWWVSLGMNDLARAECSEEVVVIGILRIVEEILEKRKNAQIVINSLFPMFDVRGDVYPLLNDYKDAFRSSNGMVNPQSLFQPNKANEGGNGRRLSWWGSRPKPEIDSTTAAGNPEGMSKDDLASLEAEQEEEYREKLYRNRYDFRNDPVDPILGNKKKVKKYKFGTGHRRKNKLPLWRSIRTINEELRKFASKHDRVQFNDYSGLFVQKIDEDRFRLMGERISPRGHLTEYGFALWEDAVVKHLMNILENLKSTHPELFPDSSNAQSDDSIEIQKMKADDDMADVSVLQRDEDDDDGLGLDALMTGREGTFGDDNYDDDGMHHQHDDDG